MKCFVFIIYLAIKQLRQLKSLVFYTKKDVFDFCGLGLNLIVLIIFTYLCLTEYHLPEASYLILSATLFYLREGITDKGIYSKSKFGQFTAWNQIEDVKILLEDDVKLIYVFNDSKEELTFKKKDYDKILEFVNKNTCFNKKIT